ncbi:hypothetical protein [Devosia sediminis]|uniref:Uncharacterized protein n=1 Tax=Devosia sediminis TaxID=2798801 RepID=A0A934IMF4_9HYPH|nr:hypothetical protein [Devosia sediminis]MBJ3783368.1 hypothetical protein [Devosia sediminis]
MPKNQFQRPAPVKHTNQVPRHGKPLPQRKVEARSKVATERDGAPLPSLHALLGRTTSSP